VAVADVAVVGSDGASPVPAGRSHTITLTLAGLHLEYGHAVRHPVTAEPIT
jgi:hypothetical protein